MEEIQASNREMRPRTEARDDNLDDDDDLAVAKEGPSAVTVEDTGALDCGVCYLPLKPPIFQCAEGHAVCCSCRDKLRATGGGLCDVCQTPLGGYLIRCRALERLVDAVRAPCPHAAHGCAARPAHHARRAHRGECPYAPRRCPLGDCGFAGAAGALLDHLAGAHFGEDAVRRFWTQELAEAMANLQLRLRVDEEDDEAWMVPADIELVMKQASVSRAEAVKALKEFKGDIVGAIMELTN